MREIGKRINLNRNDVSMENNMIKREISRLKIYIYTSYKDKYEGSRKKT